MDSNAQRTARIAVAACAALLSIALVGCATEISDAAGRTDKDSTAETPVNPESDGGERTAPEYFPTAELPESFPLDRFALPDGAIIEDAGERGADQWYLVLRATDAEAADLLWNEIISSNGFGVENEGETTEGGRVATLNGVTLTVQGLTIPQADGSVQLSYDLRGWN